MSGDGRTSRLVTCRWFVPRQIYGPIFQSGPNSAKRRGALRRLTADGQGRSYSTYHEDGCRRVVAHRVGLDRGQG